MVRSNVLAIGLSMYMVMVSAGQAMAEQRSGGLSPELIRQLRGSFRMDDQTRVLHNAIANNEINDLVLNRSIIVKHNTQFSHTIKISGITNQHRSGRCWLFAGLNTLRPRIMDSQKLDSFEFSVSYLQFWDKMEKANLFLEYMIEFRDRDYLDRDFEMVAKSPLGDGGWWNYVTDLIDKYGVVPKSAMPTTISADNTRTINKVLTAKLRADAVKLHRMHRQGASLKKLREYKERSLADVYRVLVMALGEPPAEFEWRPKKKKDQKKDAAKNDASNTKGQKTDGDPRPILSLPRKFTPKSFYKHVVGLNLGDYVCLYSDPNNVFNKHYQFKYARNLYDKPDMHFVNLPINELKKIAMNSVKANQPVWFAADVGPDQSSKHGIMAERLFDYGPLFNLDLKMTKADRIRYRAGGSNHAMVFMGVDIQSGKPTKWLVENSWGKKNGDEGKWTLYNDWFGEHVYVIIVHRRFVGKNALKIFNDKPVVLPSWYPGQSTLR